MNKKIKWSKHDSINWLNACYKCLRSIITKMEINYFCTTQSQKVGKPNHLQVFVSTKIKGFEQDSQN